MACRPCTQSTGHVSDGQGYCFNCAIPMDHVHCPDDAKPITLYLGEQLLDRLKRGNAEAAEEFVEIIVDAYSDGVLTCLEAK